MLKIKRFLALVCFLVLVVCCLPVFPAHAVVLDPVAWLYPIWVIYGQQAGVTVSSMGGDTFTQNAFPALFDEWQSYESANNGVTAQTLSSFFQTFTGFVDIGIAISQGSLASVLKVGSDLVGQLSRFWNWVIVEKLGGTGVDSVDFDSAFGNIALSSGGYTDLNYCVYNKNDKPRFIRESKVMFQVIQTEISTIATKGVIDSDIYAFFVTSESSTANNGVYYVSKTRGVQVYQGSYYISGHLDTPVSNTLSSQFLDSDYYYYRSTQQVIGKNIYIPTYATRADALFALNDPSSEGAITVSPSAGVDVLGFPDTSDPEYVPSDAVIPWNIPWDESKDTNDYLEEAYDKALDNDLTIAEQDVAPPIDDSETVGSATDYLVPGLSTVFPFCIPFDLYDFLSALAAEPEAPSFSCTLAFPAALGGPQTVVLDFDTPVFNQLAQLLRLLELLAFIVGLAFVTRSMFLRG